MTKARERATNWSSETLYKAAFYPAPEPLRFRVRRAFRNKVVAEVTHLGELRIRRCQLSEDEAIALCRWLLNTFFDPLNAMLSGADKRPLELKLGKGDD